MIKKFVQRWEERKEIARVAFAAAHPGGYRNIVQIVARVLEDEDEYIQWPDPTLITEIDHGAYQGTLVYVVGEKGCNPSHYWGVTVGYGSCSGCDTIADIMSWNDEPRNVPPTPRQVAAYMQLAFDVVRGLKQIGGIVWDETTEDEVKE